MIYELRMVDGKMQRVREITGPNLYTSSREEWDRPLPNGSSKVDGVVVEPTCRNKLDDPFIKLPRSNKT